MNKFEYKIPILSHKKIKLKKNIQLFNTEFVINSIYTDINKIEKYFPFNGILINDCKHIKYLLKTYSQIEIFTQKKCNIKNNRVFYIDNGNISEYIINAFYNRRYITPFLNKLKENRNVIRFCSPGHMGKKNGSIYTDDISVSKLDIGSLLIHSGSFKQLEKKIANIYNTKYSFINVHGTSVSNRIIISTLLKKNDKIIVDRNIHKSIIHSIILSGAKPIFIKANYNKDFNVLLQGKHENILQTIKENKNAKLLILSNPSYEGIAIDLGNIINIAHNYNMKVLVDEAWGSHLIFSKKFPKSAIEYNADYIVQSFHKTLSSFTMSSVIHVNDKDFKKLENDFIENYLLYSSTSPFYPIIASIDSSIKEYAIYGEEYMRKIIKIYNYIKEKVVQTKNLRLLSDFINNEYCSIDYSRITIGFNYDIDIKRFNELLEKNNIVLEKNNGISFTILISHKTRKRDIDKLFNILNNLKIKNKTRIYWDYSDIKISLLPQIAFNSLGEWIDIKKSIGRISAVTVVPYPPGIPIIIPGQRIEKNTIMSILNNIKHNNAEIHGIIKNKIKVVCEK